MLDNVYLIPVIKARPLEMFVPEKKSQRADQVEAGSCRRTGPGDIAGVLRDFRLEENHIYF